METRIYLTNLAKYNEGVLKGEWLDLPMFEDELQEALDRILGDDEEYFITDYEAPFDIDEHDNLSELNEFCEELERLHDTEQACVLFLIAEIGCTRDGALRDYQDVIFYEGMTLTQVAEEFVDDGLFGDVSDNLKMYIDYGAVGRDLEMDGYHETDKGVFCYR